MRPPAAPGDPRDTCGQPLPVRAAAARARPHQRPELHHPCSVSPLIVRHRLGGVRAVTAITGVVVAAEAAAADRRPRRPRQRLTAGRRAGHRSCARRWNHRPRPPGEHYSRRRGHASRRFVPPPLNPPAAVNCQPVRCEPGLVAPSAHAQVQLRTRRERERRLHVRALPAGTTRHQLTVGPQVIGSDIAALRPVSIEHTRSNPDRDDPVFRGPLIAEGAGRYRADDAPHEDRVSAGVTAKARTVASARPTIVVRAGTDKIAYCRAGGAAVLSVGCVPGLIAGSTTTLFESGFPYSWGWR